MTLLDLNSLYQSMDDSWEDAILRGTSMNYLQADQQEPEELGNAATTGLLRDYANGLPETSELRHLLDHGWSQEPRALASEVGQLLDTQDLPADLRTALGRARDVAKGGQAVVTMTQGAG